MWTSLILGLRHQARHPERRLATFREVSRESSRPWPMANRQAMTSGRHSICRSCGNDRNTPMLKITRATQTGGTRVTVSGRIGAPQLPELRRFLEGEKAGHVWLDLTEVSIVDLETVQFLLRCEGQGVELVGCPAYIREWMVRERRPQ
jgi:hypothetical protein